MEHAHFIRPLPPRSVLARHMARGTGLAAALVIGSLALGTLGYHTFEHLTWLDSELNAAMILGGMGPVNPIATVGGKVFASAYALFAGLVFLSCAALIFTPLAKRTLHRLHLDIHAEPTSHHTADRQNPQV